MADILQFMKTRSSAGVGQKVDLAFDVAGLRITDLDPSPDTTTVVTNDLLAKAKANIKITENKVEGSIVENNLQAMARLDNLSKRTE